MGRNLPLRSALFLVSIALSFFTFAQTFKLQGHVTEKNSPVPDASVVLVGTDRSTNTDMDGDYRFNGLPAGAYTVRIAALGFTSKQEAVRLEADMRLSMEIEAAAIDGASAWQRFRLITIPLMRPIILFVSVITMIGYLQFFEEPFVMTNGGPLDSTISMSMYTYKQFGFGNYGYAASISYIIFVVIAIVTAIQFRLLRENQ